MDINNNPDYSVPHIDNILAEYLKSELSVDAQFKCGGVLSNKERSEPYLLGFLSGLAYAQNVIDIMLMNQEAVSADEHERKLVDMTENYLNT